MVLGLYRPQKFHLGPEKQAFWHKRYSAKFLGSLKAQNHQNGMDLSQVNRPMGLGQNFGTQLTFNGVQGGQNRLKISKTPNFQIFLFLRPQKSFVRPKIHRKWKFRYKQCKKWKKKNKNRAGGYFDIRPRTWEVWFWPSLANCPLSAPNYPYVQWVLHGWNRTDLTIPKWYDTWYLGWKMAP